MSGDSVVTVSLLKYICPPLTANHVATSSVDLMNIHVWPKDTIKMTAKVVEWLVCWCRGMLLSPSLLDLSSDLSVVVSFSRIIECEHLLDRAGKLPLASRQTQAMKVYSLQNHPIWLCLKPYGYSIIVGMTCHLERDLSGGYLLTVVSNLLIIEAY